MSGPLAGVRVLDLSTLLPGPFATMVLADLGADVVRVEAPGRHDMVRAMGPDQGQDSAAHKTLNRGKRSLAVDLKHPEGPALIKRLLPRFDILLESFRPGVMARFGLGYSDLAGENPRLVYCSLTGFGQTGPLKDRAGHDINYLALSGLASYTGRKGSGPVPLGAQLADIGGGSYPAVVAILAAMIERGQTGQGQYLDVAITDGTFALNALFGAEALGSGVEPDFESNLLNGGSHYDYYQTRDGRYLSVGALEPQFLAGLLACLAIATETAHDTHALKTALRDQFAMRTLSEWQALFASFDVCVEPVLTVAEAAAHPQLVERQMVLPVEDGSGGSLRQIASPFMRCKLATNTFAGRRLGADNEAVLREYGFDADEVAMLVTAGVVGDCNKD